MPSNEEPGAHPSTPIGGTEFDKKYPKDSPGGEWGPNARIWRIYGDQADDWNTDMLKRWNGETDVLLIFAGLFSAVLTAFLIESYKLLQPAPPIDYMKLVYLSITAIANNHSIPGLPEAPPQLATSAQPTAQLVNVFWFLALFLSLTAAFVCILAKQWLAEYLPKQRDTDSKCAFSRLQQFRRDGLATWHVPGIISGLPVLLHCSLFLYFAGLVLFLWPLSIGIAATILILAASIFVAYIVCIFLPLCWPNCGFRTPLSRIMFSIFQRLRTHPGEKDSEHHNILNAERALIAQNEAEIDANALDWLASATSSPETYDAILDSISVLQMAVPLLLYPAAPFRVANYLVGMPLYKKIIARAPKEWNILPSQFHHAATLRAKYIAVFAHFVPLQLPPDQWHIAYQLAQVLEEVSQHAGSQPAESDTVMLATLFYELQAPASAGSHISFMNDFSTKSYIYPETFKISSHCAQIIADRLLWAGHVISEDQTQSEQLYCCVALLACRRSRAGPGSLRLFLQTLKTIISYHHTINIPLQLENADPSHFAIEIYSYLLLNLPNPQSQSLVDTSTRKMLLENLLEIIGQALPLPVPTHLYHDVSWCNHLVKVLESGRFRGRKSGWYAGDIRSILVILAPVARASSRDVIIQVHMPFLQWCLEIGFTSSQPEDVTTHLVNCLFDYSAACVQPDPKAAIDSCINCNLNLFAALTGHRFYMPGKHPIGRWLQLFTSRLIAGQEHVKLFEDYILVADPVPQVVAAIAEGLPADEAELSISFLTRLMHRKPGYDVWPRAMHDLRGEISNRIGLISENLHNMDESQRQRYDALDRNELALLKAFTELQAAWREYSRAALDDD